MTDGLYERARDDAALRRRLAAAYSGHGELMDALWWYGNPDLPAPSGEPSPSARVRELESRLYSRQARPEDAAETSRRLRDLREEIRTDRDAIARALAEVKNPPVADPRADAPAGSAHRTRSAGLPAVAESPSSPIDPSFASPAAAVHETDDDDVEDLEHAQAEHHDTVLRRMRGSSWALPVATAVAGLLVGSAVTAAVLAGVGGASGTAFPGTSGARASGAASAALAVFDEPRTADDTPERLFSTTLVPDSFHHLGTSAPLYAARDLAGDACLVLVQDDGGYTANCTEGGVFPSVGIEVSGVYKLPDPVVQGEGSSDDPSTVDATSSTDNDVFAEVDAVWLPDGQVQLSRTLSVRDLGGPVDG